MFLTGFVEKEIKCLLVVKALSGEVSNISVGLIKKKLCASNEIIPTRVFPTKPLPNMLGSKQNTTISGSWR